MTGFTVTDEADRIYSEIEQIMRDPDLGPSAKIDAIDEVLAAAAEEGDATALEAAARTAQPAPAEPTDEEQQFIDMALLAADSGSAGHWPTVAGYLADEVRRLRAILALVPQPTAVVDEAKLAEVLRAHMNFTESYGDRDPNMPLEEVLFCTCEPGEPLTVWVQTSPDSTCDELFTVTWAAHVRSALLAAGVFKTEAEVRATAIEEVAEDAGYAVVKLDDPKAIDKVADVLKHRWGFHDPVRSSYQATARRALAALGEPEAKEANDG